MLSQLGALLAETATGRAKGVLPITFLLTGRCHAKWLE